MPSNFNSTTPAAPGGGLNVVFQTDGSGNDSAYVPAGSFGSPSAVQQESYTYAADTGAANVYVVSQTPAPTLVAGSVVQFKATNANTGASTLALNGGSATAITKNGTTALSGGEIAAGQIVEVIYDGTVFQLQGNFFTASTTSVNNQTANYTAVIGDANNIVTMNVGSANTFTVPPNSSVAFAIGTTLTVIQLGTGQITLTQGAGVTFNTPSSLTARAQFSTVSLIQVSANSWVVAGDLT